MANWLSTKPAKILTFVLLGQATLFYGFSRQEHVPAHKPLEQFSFPNNVWTLKQDAQLDKETLDVLQADDILSRIYQDRENGQFANLFVAFFTTQRTGKTPHSPKNCLPGTGWVPSESGFLQIAVQGESMPINVNRYVVARGQNQSVVLYWYQARDRVIASEYSAKIFTVTDAIRFNRSDTALVRVVTSVENGDTAKATSIAEGFVRAFFEPLRHYLPV